MELFGYERNKKKTSLAISEASMICSKEELDKIVEFSAFSDFISFERKGKNKVKRV